MSEEEEANDGDEDQNEEEEQEDQENEDEDDEDEEDEDQNSEEEDSDQQEQSDQEDGQEENEEPQDSGGKEEQGEQEDNEHHLPEFRRVEQEFKFPNILAELASLSTSVDSLIETFPSHAAGTAYRYMSQQSAAHNPYLASTTNNHIATENSRAQTGQAAYSPRVVVMKDEDIQVSMQPQIIIQPTRIEKQPSLQIQYDADHPTRSPIRATDSSLSSTRRTRNSRDGKIARTSPTHQGQLRLSQGVKGKISSKEGRTKKVSSMSKREIDRLTRPFSYSGSRSKSSDNETMIASTLGLEIW